MKLVAEQIKYLRKRKKELESKKSEYVFYCKTRESAGLDSIGAPHYVDFQEDMENSSARHELKEIDRALSRGEYVMERNFDMIDIGTAFYLDFGDGELDKTMLVEKNIANTTDGFYASIESDLGQAVRGKHEGDEVTYTVTATGRPITVKITEIDRVRDHYEHFLKEKAYTNRFSEVAARELKELKQSDPAEYEERHAITPSQEALLKEELEKINIGQKDPTSVSHRGHLHKLLGSKVTVPNPEDDRIQIGSHVEVLLEDETGARTHEFELINRAVSTEIESDYVERISPLGQVIYGLRADDTFTVRRNHKPGIKGIVVSVTNDYYKERVK